MSEVATTRAETIEYYINRALENPLSDEAKIFALIAIAKCLQPTQTGEPGRLPEQAQTQLNVYADMLNLISTLNTGVQADIKNLGPDALPIGLMTKLTEVDAVLKRTHPALERQ